MDFKEFANSMESSLNTHLKDSHPDIAVRQESVDKLQDESYTALSVMPAGDRIGVNINLDDLFDRMNSGSSYESGLPVDTTGPPLPYDIISMSKKQK
ncbi:hypothetical protein [Muricomes intestini]|jgi:hypothetical protein|uniref:Uncharacterized protein n=1 Tax=Muricomes intestini TaxID=1796634 RepID=A0A4R3JZV2_9FIRM|nr:hypothetical protein [Muricomes intestini]TCS73109.1 hypothetical protein EDD59_1483 [Muricomes intestini]